MELRRLKLLKHQYKERQHLWEQVQLLLNWTTPGILYFLRCEADILKCYVRGFSLNKAWGWVGLARLQGVT